MCTGTYCKEKDLRTWILRPAIESKTIMIWTRKRNSEDNNNKNYLQGSYKDEGILSVLLLLLWRWMRG